jgi:hypothetical protein
MTAIRVTLGAATQEQDKSAGGDTFAWLWSLRFAGGLRRVGGARPV